MLFIIQTAVFLLLDVNSKLPTKISFMSEEKVWWVKHFCAIVRA